MTNQQDDEFTARYTYSRAQGFDHPIAMRISRDSVIMRYGYMLQAALMGSFLLSAAITILSPWFTHVGGIDRINALGWFMVGGMALSAYFPIKAKSTRLWIVYAIVAIPIIVLVCL